MENIKTLIQENKDCKMEKVCCVHSIAETAVKRAEMENDHYNDGNRRCTTRIGRHLVR